MHPRARATIRGTLLAAAWAVATVLAAAIAWGAVARLSQVGATVTAPLTQADVQRALAQHSPTPGPSSPSSPSSPSTRSTRGSTASTSPSSARPQRFMSWTTTGGNVGASCRGDRISVNYATPRDGWTVLPLAQQGPRLTVTFTGGNHVSTLAAECRAGIPSGTVEERSTVSGGGYDDGGNDHGDG